MSDTAFDINYFKPGYWNRTMWTIIIIMEHEADEGPGQTGAGQGRKVGRQG